jgi:hypothetical protein
MDVQLSEQFPQIRWQNIDIKESPLPCMIYDCSRYATMTCIAHNGRDYSKLTHFEVKICDECREAYLMQYLGMGQGEEDEDPFWSQVDRNEKCFVFWKPGTLREIHQLDFDAKLVASNTPLPPNAIFRTIMGGTGPTRLGRYAEPPPKLAPLGTSVPAFSPDEVAYLTRDERLATFVKSFHEEQGLLKKYVDRRKGRRQKKLDQGRRCRCDFPKCRRLQDYHHDVLDLYFCRKYHGTAKISVYLVRNLILHLEFTKKGELAKSSAPAASVLPSPEPSTDGPALQCLSAVSRRKQAHQQVDYNVLAGNSKRPRNNA